MEDGPQDSHACRIGHAAERAIAEVDGAETVGELAVIEIFTNLYIVTKNCPDSNFILSNKLLQMIKQIITDKYNTQIITVMHPLFIIICNYHIADSHFLDSNSKNLINKANTIMIDARWSLFFSNQQ